MTIHIRNIALPILGLCFLLSAQTLPGKELLNKKNLTKIEQQIVQNPAQIQQAATKQMSTLKTEEGIPLVGDLNDADEQALGRETAGRLLSVNPVVKNDSLQRYVNLIGTYVAQQSKRPALAWTFGVIESDDINAFAMPGGYIVLTSGLYKTLRNEAELAGVLGHEIAHVNLRHHVRLMQKQLLIARGKDFLVSQTRQNALRELAGSGAVICARSLDREAEFEADRTGVQYAAKSGYDPYAYLDALDRMGANNQTDRLSLLFKTHPHPRDRIAALEKETSAKWGSVSGLVPMRLVAW